MTELTLRDRVLQFVSACPNRTVDEIARSVMARNADVRVALRSLVADGELISIRLTGNGPRHYKRSLNGSDRTGRAARRKTQEERLLAILEDERWHTSEELYKRVPCIVHSRIARLRRRVRVEGWDIVHEGGGGGVENHQYRLVPYGTSEELAGGQNLAGSSGASRGGSLPPASSDGVPDSQLPIGEAA